MNFIWPFMLFFLLGIPLLTWLYLRLQQRRRQTAARYAALGLTSASLPKNRYLPPVFFLLSLIILVFALARPEMVISLPSMEGIVILAFDSSGSMAATDTEPTRMETAKTLARDFVAQQPAVLKIGVVAFSDSGFSVQLPTHDSAAVRAAIEQLSPQRSTSLSTAITVSLDTIAKVTGQVPEDMEDFPPEMLPTPTPAPPGVYAPAAIVLLSDGENTTRGDPLEVAREAARRGVRIHTIGVGSPLGTTLEVDGFMVHTQLDEAMLREIAEISGGNYYSATTEEDLRAIYSKIQPQVMIKQEKIELTAVLTGISILLLLAGVLPSLLWYGRVL